MIRFINTANNPGDNTLPCRTPLLTANQYEKLPFHLTATKSLSHQFSNKRITHSGIPAVFNEWNSLKWLTLSNALLMSKDAAYTLLPCSVKWSTVERQRKIACYSYSNSYRITLFNNVLRGIMQCRLVWKMGFHLRSELLATVVRWAEVWWKCVPDDWSRDVWSHTEIFVITAIVCILCRIYLMKQIVRQYSMDILKQISNVPQVRWLIPQEARENQVHYFWVSVMYVLNSLWSTATVIVYYTFYVFCISWLVINS